MIEGKGSYALLMILEGAVTIEVGRLGRFVFPQGYYLYLGSARSGLSSRLRRHLRQEKALRWHIDYLATRGRVVEIWYRAGGEREECLWAQAARGLAGAGEPVPRFGASDCRCPGHLIHSPKRPHPKALEEALLAQGRAVKLHRLLLGEDRALRACAGPAYGVA